MLFVSAKQDHLRGGAASLLTESQPSIQVQSDTGLGLPADDSSGKNGSQPRKGLSRSSVLYVRPRSRDDSSLRVEASLDLLWSIQGSDLQPGFASIVYFEPRGRCLR